MFLFFLEVVYLVECGKIEVRDGKRKFLFEEIMNFGREWKSILSGLFGLFLRILG